MSSGKYDIVTDFRSLFGSTKSTKDCILYRTYDADKGVTHSIASTCNMNDPTDVGPNLDLIKAFICTDGKDWQTSAVANAADFTLSNLIKTRDARFEASFYNKPTPRAKSCYLYVTKFIPRSALEYIEKGGSPAPEFQGEKNVTGYPVIRYAEVLLNWIEAKAELATLGGPAVIQTDIDESINKIRNRPIAEEAKALGVVKTADMKLDALPDDPSENVNVAVVLSNNRNVGVHGRVNKLGVPSFVFSREEFIAGVPILEKLAEYDVCLIVLAGFMNKISDVILQAFPGKIVNIHPALLPKYGGKGMYGMHVHEAVVKAGERESGITIHYINEHYDEGAIIFQASCPVLPSDTPEEVASKVHALEYAHYPHVIESLL